MSGTLQAIYLSPEKRAEPHAVSEARLVAGQGIVGDRNCLQNNAPDKELTLIAAEAIDGFNERTGLDLPYGALRRNLLTAGIDLNALVGRRFRVGAVEAEGVELCEPCATIGRLLSTRSVSPPTVVRELLHTGGLRARILRDGVIHPGEKIERL